MIFHLNDFRAVLLGGPPKTFLKPNNLAEMRPAPAMFFALLLVLAPAFAFAFGASFVVLFRFRPSPCAQPRRLGSMNDHFLQIRSGRRRPHCSAAS
jgi:hypothetical protein